MSMINTYELKKVKNNGVFSVIYDIIFEERFLRLWRNWQTRYLQAVVPKGMWVRVPSTAPNSLFLSSGFVQVKDLSTVTCFLIFPK